MNPSAIADARTSFYLNLVGGDVNFYNDYLQLDLPQRPWQKDFSFKKEYLRERLNGAPKAGSASAEVHLPSLLVALGPWAALAFTNRGRAFVQASNVSESLARLARYGLGDADRLGLANQLLEDNRFNLHVDSYHEFALTYARTFAPNPEHFFKGGLTLKYLVGLGGGYVLNEGTGYQVYGRDSLQLRSPNVSYGYTDPQAYNQDGHGFGARYGSQRLGQGYGADLGFTYEWRPQHAQYRYRMDGAEQDDPAQNKYRLRLGVALTDLGALRYANERYVHQAALANTRTVQLGRVDTLTFNPLSSVGPTLERLVGLRSQAREFTSYLPAALRLTADYRLANHLYAGVLWTQNLLPARTIGSRTPSALALTPRLEFSRAEVAVPLIWANNYQNFQVGAMVRLGPLFVGSDNLGGIFGLTTATGANFYFGWALALHRHRRKDRDGDQVSDKYDKCPKQKGPWELKGCPAPAPPAADAPPLSSAPADAPASTAPAPEAPAPEAPAPPAAPAPEAPRP
ncbi:DUF5723 family protein [Hymenobacter nivis]|uniref:DUF5723 domain-containing protein n=1 Tax=Hymenobacter nivis TaxID=1850093 RepID=A0A2Z3GH43_9BACT|nr:DUF5723 family protein [Hymenobacter nivis]AWM32963.1 hypothetical protein DDQ68_09330 [Hymenobacter nivis]